MKFTTFRSFLNLVLLYVRKTIECHCFILSEILWCFENIRNNAVFSSNILFKNGTNKKKRLIFSRFF